MTTTDLLSRLRVQVEEERDEAIAELSHLGADPGSELVAPIEGVNDGFADAAAATEQRAETLALIDIARRRLEEAEEALARMDAGTYGVCVDCGKPIPKARLEARPLSVRDVECAARHEHG